MLQVSLDVVLNEEGFSLLVNPLVGMGTEAVHMFVTSRDTSIREKEHDILNAFRCQTDEVPVHVRIFHVGKRVSLSAVDNVRELHGISDEEERCVIAYHILDALLCVKLNGESSRIPISVRETSFSQSC